MFIWYLNMAVENILKQADFSILTEIWGQTLLSDGTLVDTRIILQDLLIAKEDPFLGPSIELAPLVATRTRATPELIQKFKDKPISKEAVFPPTAEAGFEKVDVEKIVKPTISTYLFGDYLLTITLEIIFSARNSKYRTENGAPAYALRWSLVPKITKAMASK